MTALGSKLRFDRPHLVDNCCRFLMDGGNLQALAFGIAVIALIGGGLWSAATLFF